MKPRTHRGAAVRPAGRLALKRALLLTILAPSIGLAAGSEDDARAVRLAEERSKRPEAVAHWAWRAPTRPSIPEVSNHAWPKSAIDHFVLARLEAEGIEPSPEADRTTLIRRLSVALTGLPPSPAEVDSFKADTRPDAVEHWVDRLLSSPAYGERMATHWLDLARYADSMGYAQDEPRTIWRYRDWVIDAFQNNMPFDQFTIEQLAGDLLPSPTDDQQIATAFHRNTMTNSEGGTDDEEFRVAAVIDRTNTTLEVWNGITFGCAQCHDHKSDPISQREYYELFAFFNQTEDSDRPDEAPVMLSPSPAQREELRDIDERAATIQEAIDRRIDSVTYRETIGSPPTETDADPGTPVAGDPRATFLWVDDRLPPKAKTELPPGTRNWSWMDAPVHPARFGSRSTLLLGGPSEHRFRVDDGLPLASKDIGHRIAFAFVQTHADDPPRSVGLRAITDLGDARVYLGEASPFADGGGERLGPLPAPGDWHRIEVHLDDLGLSDATALLGFGYANQNGNCWFDGAGLEQPSSWTRSQRAWEVWERRRDRHDLPPTIRRALQEPELTEADSEPLRRYYIEWIYGASRGLFARLHVSAAAVGDQRTELENRIPTTPVLRELASENHRTTHIFLRGSFLAPGDPVQPGIPAILPPLAEGVPRDRLALARWLVDAKHPLTARVLANRLWQLLFGAGLVLTSEDFGVTGEPPSHPQLLDWLATEVIRLNWDVKAILKEIATSATFRQSSNVSPALAATDLANRQLARGPSLRLDAEMIRDQALFVSGLLSTRRYGPPVRPRQPQSGLKAAFGGATDWETSPGEDAWRRSLYTLRRRTIPYPTYSIFDAPSREFCVVRRPRSNTPLQALATLNDPVHVEAAQALARRMVRDGGGDEDLRQTIDAGLRLCTGRTSTPEELEVLSELFRSTQAHYIDDPIAEEAAATHPLGPLPDELISRKQSMAAWTQVAAILLNLDETLTRR